MIQMTTRPATHMVIQSQKTKEAEAGSPIDELEEEDSKSRGEH